MDWTHAMKTLGRGGPEAHEISEPDAHRLFAAMLDGGIGDLELGALIALQQLRKGAVAELLGYCRALRGHGFALARPAGVVRPVVIASHAGTRTQANLLPLLALALRRLGVPVLLHGALTSHARTTCIQVLRELGVMPCISLSQTRLQFDEHRLAYAPTAVLAPGLAALLALEGRLGFSGAAPQVARLLDPFDGNALLVVAADGGEERALLREVLRLNGCNALLLEGTEGEAFADPCRRPRLEHIRDGEVECLFEEERGGMRAPAGLSPTADAAATARWIRRALAQKVPMPMPLVNQIACCLYGAGYTDDLNQAKAIVAVETGSLAAA